MRQTPSSATPKYGPLDPNDAMPESDPDSVIPAQLSFLAIYNPTLGPTDETLEDQIVFYTSRSELKRTEGSASEEAGAVPPLENGKNERLRQIGLAQGMVSFASNFSTGKPLEYVETDRARFVLLELEQDWWIVASIDLTRLPADSSHASSTGNGETSAYHYSAREMGPPQLLLQQLRRAHSVFLLHHGVSLEELYGRVGRPAFCLFVERFWEKFSWNWELLLTGNPIVEIYNGIKLAAGGELGIGVGEEEWGSGEREVLEDFVSRTDGLLDLVVSRFGEPARQRDDSTPASKTGDEDVWLGLDTDPRPADGVVFSGLGNISRSSLANISHWMEWIYRYGDAAYGVGRDPNSLRRRRPRRRDKQPSGNPTSPKATAQPSTPERDRSHTPGIPRPLVMATPEPTSDLGENGAESKTGSSPSSNDQGFPTETVMKYLTLGYGSAWSFSKSPSPGEPAESTGNTTQQAGDAMNTARSPPPNELRNDSRNRTSGRFILGPRDDLDTLDDLEEESPAPGSDNGKPKSRIVHRFLHTHSSDGTPKKLQAIIYVNQPFVFTFLFDPATSSLSSPSLYSSIHHQLGPLQKPLLVSTSPTTASIRISQSDTSDPNKRFSTRTHPVHDFVYDPSTLTIRSSIPNIPTLPSISLKPTRTPSPSPSPSTSTPKPAPSWSRIESLAIHHRLLTTYIDTRSRPLELERTCKTNRGWWIVWMRIPSTPTLSKASLSATLSEAESGASVSTSPVPPQEAFLVRKASDYIAAGHGRVSSGARFFRDLGGASSKSGSRASETPLKLVEGIGMDARRYIEGLLKLNG